MSNESDALTRIKAAEDAGHTVDDAASGVSVGTKLARSAATKTGYAGAAQAAAPAGGTGATAGAYDTAGHRDALIALVNAMRDVLINNGLMKGSA